MAGESGPQKDLRELYDGEYERLVTTETGKSPEEIRAMAFPERQAVLRLLGVNLPDQKEKPQNGSQRTNYQVG